MPHDPLQALEARLLVLITRERQGERTDLKPKAPDIRADLRESSAPLDPPAQPLGIASSGQELVEEVGDLTRF